MRRTTPRALMCPDLNASLIFKETLPIMMNNIQRFINRENLFVDIKLFCLAGERSLFCLNDNGSVRFMKKFEYNPSCFIPYTSGKIKINPINLISY